MTDASASAPGRRPYLTALLVTALGAALMLWGYGLVWASTEVPLLPGADLTDAAVRVQEFTGRDLYPGAASMGWLALAAVGGIIATRSWGRLAVAVIGVIAGVTGLSVAIVFAATSGADVISVLMTALDLPADVPARITPNWVVAALGGAAIVVGAAWTAVRGRGWPAMGRRYERARRDGTDVNAWDALDRGQDPTEN